MALNGDKLGKELYDALELASDIDSQEGMDQPAKSSAKSLALQRQKAIGNTIVKHIIDNLEILGIKTQLDSPAVSTNVVVNPGIMVATAGSPAAQTGATTSPGSGSGSGQVTTASTSQTNDGKGLVK